MRYEIKVTVETGEALDLQEQGGLEEAIVERLADLPMAVSVTVGEAVEA